MPIRFGEIIEVSNDKGPYKLVKVKSDGKEFDAHVWELQGVAGNPVKGSIGMIFTMDDDEGKSFIVPMVPPAKRWDQQKEGELTYGNVLTGAYVKHHENGDTTIKAPGTVTIDAAKIVMKAGRIDHNKA